LARIGTGLLSDVDNHCPAVGHRIHWQQSIGRNPLAANMFPARGTPTLISVTAARTYNS
jgi:hypothetical protein